MRFNLITIVTLVAGDLVAATPIACTEVSVSRSSPTIPEPRPARRPRPPQLTTSLAPQWKRDLILKGELPPEACCSYGRCVRDVVVAMF